jgi:hypothetical protein
MRYHYRCRPSQALIVARSRQACICIGWKQLSYSIYLVIASDLSTQCLSRQQQANGPLGTGNHILTDITVGISRPQQAPVGNGEYQPKRGLLATIFIKSRREVASIAVTLEVQCR